MIIRNTTAVGDWTYGKGLSDYLTKLDAILGNVKTRLQSWVGDCFFAPAEGVDYNNYLDKNTEDLLISDLKRVIVQSEGVLRITIFESVLDRDLRDLRTVCEIETIYGKSFIIDDVDTTQSDTYSTVNKITQGGLQKMTPNGLFKIVFVKDI